MTDEKKTISIVNIQGQIDKKLQAEMDIALTPDTETVEFLEFLLEQAKAGEIQEVCFGWRYWDGQTFDSHFTGYGELPEAMVGTLHRLIRRYETYYYEDEED